MAKTRSKKTAPSFPSFDTGRKSGERWFSRNGFVLHSGGRFEVLVGGSLIASFAEGDTASRNLALVLLSQDPSVMFERLAHAFEISSETLRLIRRLNEEEGLEAVLARSWGGSSSKVSPASRQRLEALFEQGLSVSDAHTRLGRRLGMSRSSVGNVRKEWGTNRAQRPVEAHQEELPLVVVAVPPEAVTPVDGAATSPASVEPKGDLDSDKGEVRRKSDCSERCVREAAKATRRADEDEECAPQPSAGPRSSPWLQHAGGWLMVAMLAAMGLHGRAEALNRSPRRRSALRMALDAVTIALAIGEKRVEGVRRLATRTGAALLLATSSPTAKWVRQILGAFSKEGAAYRFHFGLAGDLIRAADESGAEERPSVFFADNHCRPYTGKRRLRLGYRMQDRRARPGTADYYVSDAQGVPLYRVTVPSHGSLAKILKLLARTLRLALRDRKHFVICFDRGGAFPAPMYELKLGGFGFITYERAPCRMPSKKRLRAEGLPVVIAGERYLVIESKTNLGEGRGRLRRLSVLTPQGRRLNALASSSEDAAWLLSVLFSRWNQENGFKHGVERWGMNALDGRKVQRYPPGTIIPNPARRRLERDLKILRVREGELRRKLARPRKSESEAARAKLQAALETAVTKQECLESLRPSVPERVTVEDSELKDELVYHTPEYKMTLDTIRIACANAEAELATLLAPELPKPREAKQALKNLFRAPGAIRVGDKSINVTLVPAGNDAEMRAFGKMLSGINRRRLVLPGDPKGRPLRFRVQIA